MDGKKEYKIVINGITESINAVEALLKQLDELEKKINILQEKSINISAKASGGASAVHSVAAVDDSDAAEEIRVQNEINKLKAEGLKLDAKIIAAQDEIYKKVDANKQLYKETLADQKAIAAQERLVANAYSNTMQGMKSKLADLKAVINTTDLGDNGLIEQLTNDANELTNKLKEMEAAYGQFGRNVGNYQSAFDGLQKVSVNIGGTVREFDNAKQAAKTLRNELIGLTQAGEGNSEMAKDLRKAYNQLKSSMDDATKSSAAMDNMMDTMQSFTALASAGNGLKAFFGADDSDIQKSIQRLVALQGVLNGIESLRKQMDTGEGLGTLLTKGSDRIDNMVIGLTGAQKATNGLTMGSKAATVAVRGLSLALKGVGIGIALEAINLLVQGIEKAVDWIKDWVKGDSDLVKSTDLVNNAIAYQNTVLQKNLELIQKKLNSGQITSEQARVQTEKAYASALEETNRRLQDRADILSKNDMNTTKSLNLDSLMGDKGVTWIGGFTKAIESIKELNERWDELEKNVSNDKGMKSWLSTASDARDEFNHLNKMISSDFLSAMNKFSDGTEEGTRALVKYIDKMDELTNGRYSRAIQLTKVDNETLQKELDESWKMIQTLRDKVFKNPIVVSIELDAKISQELDRLDPTRSMQRNVDEWKSLLAKGVDEAGNKLSETQKKNIQKIIDEGTKKINETKTKRVQQIRSNAKKYATEIENAEKELNQLRIENMAEGLNKTIKQLEEERRQRISKARINGQKVAEIEAEVNKLYDKKIIDAKKEWAKDVENVYRQMWAEIYQINMQNYRLNSDAELDNLDTNLQKNIEKLQGNLDKRYSGYQKQYPSNLSKENATRLEVLDQMPDVKGLKDYVKMAKEYLDLKAEVDLQKSKQAYWVDDESIQEEVDKAEKALQDWLDMNEMSVEQMEDSYIVEKLIQSNYTESLSKSFEIRMYAVGKYYKDVEELQKKHSEETLENEKELLLKEYNYEMAAENTRFNDQLARLEEQKEKGLLTEEKYEELVKRMHEENADAYVALTAKKDAEIERLEQENQERLKSITSSFLNSRIQEYRDFYSAIGNLESRQPETIGNWGIVNIKATKRNYKEALNAYTDLCDRILDEKANLQAKLDAKEITFDDFQQANRELNDLEQMTMDATKDVQDNLNNLTGDFIQSINGYLQTGLQAFQTIMSAVWDAQDAEFDKQQEAIDKENEMLQEKLDEQEEIIEEHSNKVESIEDELATARGDRRQHLIDQLNAETEAQRQALKEKQKMEKQEEALKKRQEKLDKERQKAEYKRNLLSIIVSNAMAAANGYATKPFIPVGLAMGSLAIALGAAQYAIAASAKPYAKGGQLEGGVAVGKRHSEGGIKVLGGRAEIEGGEFITNRVSTSKNLNILEFVNGSKRKLSLDDFIEFYSTKPRTTINTVKTRFADGGYIPLPPQLDVAEQLQNIVVSQDNRPIYVTVTDIENKMEQVRYVRTLAGLGES